MKNKLFKSFRSHILFLFFKGALVSAALIVFLYNLASSYYRKNVVYDGYLEKMRIFLRYEIGDFNFFLTLFTLVSFCIFYLLTKKYTKRMDKISYALSNIAKGDFDTHIDVKSQDELGEIEKNINITSKSLKIAVSEGRFANKSKDQLIVNLAHDLRTPLTSIKGYLELIINSKELSEEERSQYSSVALKKSVQLENLIEEMFDLVKFNYGKKSIEMSDIDINFVLEQMIEDFYPVFEQNGLECRFQSNIDEKLIITGNPELIARLFDNLIINGVRHSGISKWIDINLKSKEDICIVEIVNYDSYIEKDKIPYIFESFYQVEPSRNKEKSGAGLGLAIAKSIADIHDAQIKVESSIVKTIFTVELKKKFRNT